MVFLDITGLSVKYHSSSGPVYAVDDVDIHLEDGQSIGIAGESACGKSTLGVSIIRILSGGIVQGKILFEGDSLLDLSESDFNSKYRWKKISMIFQGAMNALDPVFTIKDQFLEILNQHDFEGNSGQLILDAMNSVSLDENVLKKYP